MKKGIRVLIILIVVIAVVAVGGYFGYTRLFAQGGEGPDYTNM